MGEIASEIFFFEIWGEMGAITPQIFLKIGGKWVKSNHKILKNLGGKGGNHYTNFFEIWWKMGEILSKIF